FTVFLQDTTLTDATFLGTFGHTYGFSVTARTNTQGDLAVPNTVQATTTIVDTVVTTLGKTNLSTTEGAAFNAVVATFTGQAPDGTADGFTATITWGDGQTSAGVITLTS